MDIERTIADWFRAKELTAFYEVPQGIEPPFAVVEQTGGDSQLDRVESATVTVHCYGKNRKQAVDTGGKAVSLLTAMPDSVASVANVDIQSRARTKDMSSGADRYDITAYIVSHA